MPGITGFITGNRNPKNEVDLRLMLDSMMHEAFYSSGTYVDESSGLYLAWISLPGSFTDCMPVWNETRDKLLFFHGEDFPDTDVLNRLRNKNHGFESSNASYLIHLYEEHGRDFFKKLNGFFCGILLDLGSDYIVLFNDRFGMQRIYYYQDSDRTFFSTELKAILKVRPHLRILSAEGLAELCSMGCVLDNKTLIKDVYLLPGASLWSFKNGECKKERYFSKESWEAQPLLHKNAFFAEFRDLFEKILKKYLSCADPVTLSLTGGLDTRMIMAYNHRPPGALPCHTFGGMYHDSFDIKIAKRVAASCAQDLQVIRVDGEFLKNFGELAERTVYITDGYLDVTGATELFVNSFVRQIAPVRVTGNYGSEVMRTVRAFRPKVKNSEFFDPDFLGYLSKASELYAENVRMHPLSFALFKQAPWYGYNRLSIEQTQLVMRTPFMDNELLKLLYKAPTDVTSNDDLTHWLIAQGSCQLDHIGTDRGLNIGPRSKKAQGRAIFYEFLRLSEFCYDYGMPQWFASIDYFLKPLRVERMFLGRHRFYHFRTWYRDELAEYVKRILLDEKALRRPYYKKNAIEKIVLGHTRGYKNHTMEITLLLTVELIHQLLID